MLQFAEVFSDPWQRIIKQEVVDNFFISTVLIGTDMQLEKVGKPIIFETMIFDQNIQKCQLDLWTDRYCTEQEACEGHQKAVAMVKEFLKTTQTE